jgi:hypothetical protein
MTTEVFYRNNCIKVIWKFNVLQLHLSGVWVIAKDLLHYIYQQKMNIKRL